MRSSYLFTSESVSEGHPDKVADQISDAIVDLFLSKDPEARVACETMTTTNRVVLAGEIRGQGIMDEDGNWAPGVREEIESTVRGVVREIGYEQEGFHWAVEAKTKKGWRRFTEHHYRQAYSGLQLPATTPAHASGQYRLR